MKRIELGVFLPIAQNGFVFSSNAPPYVPSFKDQLEISLAAEEIGLDYVFAMSKWRGFGGKTDLWDASLESFSLMAALAQATTRLDLVATVTPLLFHPATMAKMAATVADASGGRLRLNIVTGATLVEYSQMGLVQPDYDRNRYAYATEWVQLLKRLWSEPRVSHEGAYFRLDDCVSDPKPKIRPQLVCAGTSDEGLRFTAREADCAFLSGRDVEDVKVKSRRAKEIAAEEGRTISTAAGFNLVLGETEADAEAYSEYLIAGADVQALQNAGMLQMSQNRERSLAHGAARLADPRRIYFGQSLIGGPEQVADALIDVVIEGELDSLLLIFPDYLEGLKRFSKLILPRLRSKLDVGATGQG